MSEKKTHRMIKSPQISARYLAQYMAASERTKRAVAKNSKYQPIAAVIQHNDAKAIVSRSFWTPNTDLEREAKRLRNRETDTDFKSHILGFNADYIERFSKVVNRLDMPKAELLPPVTEALHIELKGVKVTVEINFRLRRLTKTNRIRIGVAALRYAKGKSLSSTEADWHSAFLHGFLCRTSKEEAAQPEPKLCLVIDAYAGASHSAPTDAKRRFLDMVAACESIAAQWDNIPPPSKAIL